MNWLMDQSGIYAEATEIRWDRLHLYITVRVDVPEDSDVNPEQLDYYMVYRSGKARARFDVKPCEDGQLELHVNVTNNGENQSIPFGVYTVYLCDGEDVLASCDTSMELAYLLPERSRIFTYNAFHNSYNVQFFVEVTEEDRLPFRIHIRNLEEISLAFPRNTDLKDDILHVVDTNRHDVRYQVRRLYKKGYQKHKKTRKNTVLFLTVQSDTLVNNLKAVYDKMLERELDKQFRILVYAKNKAGLRMDQYDDWEEFIDMVTSAQYIILDDHVPAFDWLWIERSQKIIQLWHAGAGFKSSGYNRWGNIGSPGPQSAHRQYTWGIAGSKKIAVFFADGWGINEEKVIPTGMPRMDSYLDEDYRREKTEELRKKYPICEGKKVILFAPTFRGKNRSDAFYPYEMLDLGKLYEVCGENYVVLFKKHPWVNNKLVIPDRYQDRFQVVDSYPNINDLFYITDLLITDYSSGIYEYSLMRRPMLFYAFDEERYGFSRGFHRSLHESAPGKVCHDFDGIIRAIREEDFEFEKVEAYVEHHFDYFDTHSCDRVIDWFLLGEMPAEFTARLKKKREEMKRMAKLDFTRPDTI